MSEAEKAKITRRKYLTYGGGIVVVAVVAVAGYGIYEATKPPPATPTPTPTPTPVVTPTPTPTPTPTKPFEGITLTLATMTGPWISGPIKEHGPEWGKITGGKIDVIELAYADIYPKVTTSFITGAAIYDILLASNMWLGDWSPYVIPLDTYVKEPEVRWEDDVPDGIKRKDSWAGHVYCLICDNDSQYLHYREDLLKDPENQKRFKDKYGYDLPCPPTTLDQLIDVAEYFTGWDWNGDGEKDFGFIHSCAPRAQTYWYSYSWPSPYTVMPSPPASAPGIFFFDPDTMKPLVNEPGWVRGIEKFIEITKRGHPPGLDWVRAHVMSEPAISGKVAMAIDWGDIGPTLLDPKSKVGKGKMRWALPPGSMETWDYKNRKWVKWDKPNYAPVHCYNGWSYYITKTCKYPDAAWSFVKYMISPEISAIDVASPYSGYQPWRKSHLKLDPWIKAGWLEADAKAYVQNTINVTDHPNAVIDMRIPGAARYSEEIYEPYLCKALAGELSVKDALDRVANEWDKVTDEIGREKQIAAYKAHLGMK